MDVQAIFHRLVAWLLVVCLPTSVVAQDATEGESSSEAAETSAEGGKDVLPEWERVLDDVLAIDFLDIAVWRLAASVGLIALGFALRGYLLEKLLTPIRLIVDKTETRFDEKLLASVRAPLGWLVNVVAFYFAALVLNPPDALMKVVSLLLQTVGTVLVAWLLWRSINIAVRVLDTRAEGTESQMDDQLVPVVRRVLRFVLFVIVGIAIIQQWGYDVTSLLAGLGIGGLAVALAAQNTLSNWFGALMIFTDRPFQVGDIVKGDFGEGVVEEVGLRSTKVRTYEKTLITVPNAKISGDAVENFSARPVRRIRAELGLVYGTTEEQMRQIIEEIGALFAEHEQIEPETWVVHFTEFGDSALMVLVQCYALTTDYDEWSQLRQDLYLRIIGIVHEAGSDFAFPSQSIYVENALSGRN
jgi:MscS family membrane protein